MQMTIGKTSGIGWDMGFFDDAMVWIRHAASPEGRYRTPAGLAAASGVDTSLITRWLKGERRPTLDKLAPILDMLGAKLLLPGEELGQGQETSRPESPLARELRDLSDELARLGFTRDEIKKEVAGHLAQRSTQYAQHYAPTVRDPSPHSLHEDESAYQPEDQTRKTLVREARKRMKDKKKKNVFLHRMIPGQPPLNGKDTLPEEE